MSSSEKGIKKRYAWTLGAYRYEILTNLNKFIVSKLSELNRKVLHLSNGLISLLQLVKSKFQMVAVETAGI